MTQMLHLVKIHDRFTDLANRLHHWFTDLANRLHDRFTDLANRLHNRFTDLANRLHDRFTDLANRLHDLFTDLANRLHDLFTDLANRLHDRITTLPRSPLQPPSSLAPEAAGAHSLDVELQLPGGGTLAQAVTVDVVDLLSGTAIDPSDYAFTSPTLSFPAGSAAGTQSVSLSLVDDNLVEGDETIDLQLTNLVDGTGDQVSLVSPSDHTVTITIYDCQPMET